MTWRRERLGSSRTEILREQSSSAHSDVSDLAATVWLEGLQRPLRLMHISDSHVDTGLDGGEEVSAEKFAELEHRLLSGERLNPVEAAQVGGYPMVTSYADGQLQRAPSNQVLPAVVSFEQQVSKAVSLNTDLIVLTGDNVNFPSERAVNCMVTVLKSSGIPWVYISGNHDWDMHAQPGSPMERRKFWQSTTLAPLYGGRDSLAWSEDINGVRIVALDNSIGEVSTEQVAFFTHAAADSPLPVLLLVHIPLYSPGLSEAMCGAPFSRRPGAPIEPAAATGDLCGDPGDPTTTEATRDLIQAVEGCKRLAAVLSGHIHTAQAHAIGRYGGMQYVADAGVFGGYRVLDLMPMMSATL